MKIRKIFLSICLACVMMFGLTACGSDPDKPGGGNTPPASCSHSYTTTITQPTCTTQGYTTHTCSKCHNSYKDTYTNALGHSFVSGDRNYSCSKCHVSECDGFSFKLATMDGESCYVVTNATEKTVINGVLEVPRVYESLPVRGIMSWSFSGVADKLKTLKIHDNIKNIYSYLFNGTSIWDSDLDYKCPIENVVFDSTCSNMRIESDAFYNCTKLANVNLRAGMVLYIPCDAVFSYGGGGADYLFKGTPYYTNNVVKKNGLCYIADLLLHADVNDLSTNVVIDSGTVAINSAVFANTTHITSVTIPSSLKRIGDKAFYGCTNLATITFNGTKEDFNRLTLGPSTFSSMKAKKVICSNGEVTQYYYNGYTYLIGE